MSRVRNTLDTVSKAVGGTHSELLSKITRLKPGALKAREKAEATVELVAKTDEGTTAPSPTNAAPHSSSTTPKTISEPSCISPSIPAPAATSDSSATPSTPPLGSSHASVTATSLTVSEPKEKRLRRVVPFVKAGSARKVEEVKPSPSDTDSKSTTPALFHPSTFSVSLDQTYNYLAHHINSYFDSSTKTQDKKVDNVEGQTSDMSASEKTVAPVAQTPSKKGLGHYLSYSAPTVQAFVGSYIAPLVPKFRTAESKSAAVVEKKPEDSLTKQAEATVSSEQKAAEEKAKKLLLQREKVGPQKSVLQL